MALSHDAGKMQTSVLWNLSERMNSQSLSETLKSLNHYAFHPMLVPCIMFDEILQIGIQRRNSTKWKMKYLEERLADMHVNASSSPSPTQDPADSLGDFEDLVLSVESL